MFPSIYVINLDHREDRKQLMAYQLNELKLVDNCIFVGAVNGKTPNDSTNALFSTYFPTNSLLSGGAKGCALSHILLWRHILNSQEKSPYHIILEDDVLFDVNFVESVMNLLSNDCIKYKDSHDIYLLGTNYFNEGDLKIENKETDIDKYSHIPKTLGCGTHGYLVSNKGLEKLINLYVGTDEHKKQIVRPIDIFFQDIHINKSMIFRVINKVVVIQKDFSDSDT
jgi:GR25 family glycosyltransferase involved in LPS biosynthesis